MHKFLFPIEFEFQSSTVILKLDQGHQNLITSFPYTDDVSVLVLINSSHWLKSCVHISFFYQHLSFKEQV